MRTVITKHYNRGNAYYRQGKYKQAIASYQKAISINPDDADAHYNLARVYVLNNEKALSIESLQKAITLDRRAIEASKTNSEFDNIRESSEFQQLINPK